MLIVIYNLEEDGLIQATNLVQMIENAQEWPFYFIVD